MMTPQQPRRTGREVDDPPQNRKAWEVIIEDCSAFIRIAGYGQ